MAGALLDAGPDGVDLADARRRAHGRRRLAAPSLRAGPTRPAARSRS
ncbi:MAG: hypothetical protein V9E94_14150 [Microthrixaceae bacterium]